MFSKALSIAILAGVALAQTFSINTPPSIQQCQPASLTWVGGTAPFILAAIPAGQATAPAIATIAEGVSGSPYTWNVNLPQGTAITIRITDSTGAFAFSSPLTVQAGSQGCLSGSGASAVPSASLSSASSVNSANPTPSGTPSVSSIVRPSVSSSVTGTSAAPTSAPASSGSANPSSSATSRPAGSASVSPTSAALTKASFQVPVLALAGVGAFVALGGFAALL